MSNQTVINQNWLSQLGIVTSDQFGKVQKNFIDSCIKVHTEDEGKFIGYRFLFSRQQIEMIFEKGVLTYDRDLVIIGASIVHKVN